MLQHRAENERFKNGSGMMKSGFSFVDNSVNINVPQNGLSGTGCAAIGLAVVAASAVAVGGYHIASKGKETQLDPPIAGVKEKGNANRERKKLVEDLMARHGVSR